MAYDALELAVLRDGLTTFDLLDVSSGSGTAELVNIGLEVASTQPDLDELHALMTPIGVACGRKRSTEIFPDDGVDPIRLRRTFRNAAIRAHCDPRPHGELSARWHMVHMKLCHLSVLGLEAFLKHSVPTRTADMYAGLIKHERTIDFEHYNACYGWDEDRRDTRLLLISDPEFDIFP